MTVVRAIILLGLAIVLAACDSPNTAPAWRLLQPIGGGPDRLSEANGS